MAVRNLKIRSFSLKSIFRSRSIASYRFLVSFKSQSNVLIARETIKQSLRPFCYPSLAPVFDAMVIEWDRWLLISIFNFLWNASTEVIKHWCKTTLLVIYGLYHVSAYQKRLMDTRTHDQIRNLPLPLFRAFNSWFILRDSCWRQCVH